MKDKTVTELNLEKLKKNSILLGKHKINQKSLPLQRLDHVYESLYQIFYNDDGLLI